MGFPKFFFCACQCIVIRITLTKTHSKIQHILKNKTKVSFLPRHKSNEKPKLRYQRGSCPAMFDPERSVG